MRSTIFIVLYLFVLGCGSVGTRGDDVIVPPPASQGASGEVPAWPTPYPAVEPAERHYFPNEPSDSWVESTDGLPEVDGTLPTLPLPEPECRTDDDCGVGGGCGCVQNDLGDQYWACTYYTGRCVVNSCVRDGHGVLCPRGCGDDDRGCYECTEDAHCQDGNDVCWPGYCGVDHFCAYNRRECSGEGQRCISRPMGNVRVKGCVQCTDNQGCDDHNPCTQDVCNLLGHCVYDNEGNETPCGGNGSICQDGTCMPPGCGTIDTDHDGVDDECDNCIFIFNSDQRDNNENGTGDACDQREPAQFSILIAIYEEVGVASDSTLRFCATFMNARGFWSCLDLPVVLVDGVVDDNIYYYQLVTVDGFFFNHRGMYNIFDGCTAACDTAEPQWLFDYEQRQPADRFRGIGFSVEVSDGQDWLVASWPEAEHYHLFPSADP